jgi:hypothetical protein
MGGALKVGMRGGMALEALCICRLGRGFRELKYFGYVTAAFDMSFAWPVAAFAGYPFPAVHHSETGMGILGKLLGHIFMAGFAGL